MKKLLLMLFVVVTTFSMASLQDYQHNLDYDGDMTVPTTVSFHEHTMPNSIDDIDFNAPIRIFDLDAALLLGKLCFLCPTSNHATCEKCHNIDKGGFSNFPFPVGLNGEFDRTMKKYIEDWKVDLQPVGTPPFLNGWDFKNALTDGSLGIYGMNATVSIESLINFNPNNAKGWDGYYTQVFAAFDAHVQRGIAEEMSKFDFFNNLALKAFGKDKMTDDVVAVAIGIFEKSFITNQAPYQKYTRGEIAENKLRSKKGKDLFLKHCTSCHSGKAFGGHQRAMKIGKSDFEGFFRVTKDSSDYGMVVAPSLYNTKDASGKFHTEDQISNYRATNAHTIYDKNDPTWKPNLFELMELKKFVDWDLFDPYCGKRTLKIIDERTAKFKQEI